jgi:hypothetical protein
VVCFDGLNRHELRRVHLERTLSRRLFISVILPSPYLSSSLLPSFFSLSFSLSLSFVIRGVHLTALVRVLSACGLQCKERLLFLFSLWGCCYQCTRPPILLLCRHKDVTGFGSTCGLETKPTNTASQNIRDKKHRKSDKYCVLRPELWKYSYVVWKCILCSLLINVQLQIFMF